MDEHSKKVARALEGNERVFFDPHDGTLAVWYGSTRVEFYDSETWEKTDETYVPSDATAVEVNMAHDGFDRKGRGANDWILIPSED